MIDNTFNMTVIPQYDIWPHNNIYPKNPSINDRINNNNPVTHIMFMAESK